MTSADNTHSWRTTLLSAGSTIQHAIKSLELSSRQIVLVVSEDDMLVGTITDGDIRRAFLQGLKLDDSIESVVHKNPQVVAPEISATRALEIMQANKIRQLPVVDREGRVVGLHIWDALVRPAKLDNFVVIMAGGRGVRLHPHTQNCPKPMLEVGGKPMLEHIIEHAKAEGFQNFMISLHYLGEMIEEYFGDGSKWGVTIDYLREKSPLGTAGCLSLLPSRPELPFVIINGDVMTDIKYRDILDFHVTHQASATMAVRQFELVNQFGVVNISGIDIDGFEEKPVYRSYINAGIYVLSPAMLAELERDQQCDMPTLFERIRHKGQRTIVFPMHESWLDVGRPSDLEHAKQTIKKD